MRNEGETTRGSVSVSLRVEGKSGSRAAVSFRVEGKSGSRAAHRFWFRFVSSGARFRETGFDFLVLSVTLPGTPFHQTSAPGGVAEPKILPRDLLYCSRSVNINDVCFV